jgi:hypothetical protein
LRQPKPRNPGDGRWRFGSRLDFGGNLFLEDLAGRLASRVQLTSDSHKAYLLVNLVNRRIFIRMVKFWRSTKLVEIKASSGLPKDYSA